MIASMSTTKLKKISLYPLCRTAAVCNRSRSTVNNCSGYYRDDTLQVKVVPGRTPVQRLYQVNSGQNPNNCLFSSEDAAVLPGKQPGHIRLPWRKATALGD